MRRDLLSERYGAPDDELPVVRGAVVLDGDQVRWEGLAEQTFNGIRHRLGDLEAARQLIKLGWSNGQCSMYLGPVQD